MNAKFYPFDTNFSTNFLGYLKVKIINKNSQQNIDFENGTNNFSAFVLHFVFFFISNIPCPYFPKQKAISINPPFCALFQ